MTTSTPHASAPEQMPRGTPADGDGVGSGSGSGDGGDDGGGGGARVGGDGDGGGSGDGGDGDDDGGRDGDGGGAIVIDFQCPFCKQFEETAGSALERLAASGLTTLVCQPMAVLDRLSTGHCSSRASPSPGCVAAGSSRTPTHCSPHPRTEGQGSPAGVGGPVTLADPAFTRCMLGHARLGRSVYVTFAVGAGSGPCPRL
ncbi:hypothetical protein [Actinoallomurus acaciae]|uniref:Thioredoxin-like fold domain-containing protein n=1 Tax=Actinoallomurus acaciae TaxID=502577 RepID=A0ABV5YA16_9ACTN